MGVGAAALSPPIDNRVVGHKYRAVGSKPLLKIHRAPGDPHGADVVAFLRRGEDIVATGFKNFAGQTWIRHRLDGKEQQGWCAQDLQGARWLQCLDLPLPGQLAELPPPDTELPPEGYDYDNLFAKILRGEMPGVQVVLETQHALVVLAPRPRHRFHCVLLPRAASASLDDLSERAAGAALAELPRLCRAVRAAAAADGVTVTCTAGRVGTPAWHVPQTHVDIVPAFDDPLGQLEREERAMRNARRAPDEAADAARRLRECLRREA